MLVARTWQLQGLLPGMYRAFVLVVLGSVKLHYQRLQVCLNTQYCSSTTIVCVAVAMTITLAMPMTLQEGHYRIY